MVQFHAEMEYVSAWQSGARKGFLILLAPARERIAMIAKLGIASKFAHDSGLLYFEVQSLNCIRGGMPYTTDIFIVAQHVEIVCDGVLNADCYAVALSDSWS